MVRQKYGKMTGWGAYVPEKVLTNDDLAQMVDTSDEWIVRRSGIRERRIAAPEETTSSMSVQASLQAMAQAGVTAADLDLIIVATSTPDYHCPPMSSLVQDELGATNVPAFVLVNGCAGWVYAMSVAYQFIATGVYNTILVVGVELLSRFVDWQDRATCVLFGDAAGAAILQSSDEPCGMLGLQLGSDGSQAEHLILPAGGTVEPFNQEAVDNRRYFLQMNGRAVFRFASKVVGEACRAAVADAGISLDDIDWIIPHQANLRIIQAASREMNVPLDRFVINIEKYANTSAATIPLALTEAIADGRVKPSDKLLFVSFGAGLTWGAMVIQMAPSLG